jgi:hypothetical protein
LRRRSAFASASALGLLNLGGSPGLRTGAEPSSG